MDQLPNDTGKVGTEIPGSMRSSFVGDRLCARSISPGRKRGVYIGRSVNRVWIASAAGMAACLRQKIKRGETV